MLTSSISNTCRCHSVGVSCNLLWTLVIFWLIDRCCCQMVFVLFELMADVIANIVFVADVLATVVHVWWNWHEAKCYDLGLLCDWCCCHLCIDLVTDVVVTFDVKFYLADVKANVGKHFNCCKGCCPWLVLLPLRHIRLMSLPLYCFKADVIAFFLLLLADVIAWWLIRTATSKTILVFLLVQLDCIGKMDDIAK